MTADEPSLFDVVDPDGTRTPGIFRAAAPKRARRTTSLPPPTAEDPTALAARAAEYRAKWAESTRAARAKFETPEGPDA